ncbi:MAG: NADH-quinone oxidoreductase subunit NuoH [Bacteroidota bacterium]
MTIPEALIQVLITGIKIFMIFNVVLVAAAYMVYAERKVSAWMQERIGPNRVGPYGLLQSFADVVKLVMKEDIVPAAADKFFHTLAPLISISVAIAVYSVIPFGNFITIAGRDIPLSIAPDLNIGLLIVLALTSVGVFGITLAGWSSNNKYSLLGGLRSSAQMISYELSMGLAVIGVLMLSNSLNLNEIVKAQSGLKWNIFFQPFGFIIFMVAALAETNRAPFDLAEAEPELVGGYHTEYTGMKFGLFYLAEYANMLASSAIIATLFFGGWQVPFLPEILGLKEGSLILVLLQTGAFITKTLVFVFIFIWIRWSTPRFRYDQLMNLGWKVLLPLSLANIILTGIGITLWDYFTK